MSTSEQKSELAAAEDCHLYYSRDFWIQNECLRLDDA